MAASQVRFKWTDHKLTNLVKCSQEFKSSMEFRNCDSNADKVKWHESVRKGLAEIYEDEPDAFGPASVSENPYKDLDDVNEFDLREYQVKVKTEKEQIKRRFEAKIFLFTLLYFNPAWNFSYNCNFCQLGIPSWNFNPGGKSPYNQPLNLLKFVS